MDLTFREFFNRYGPTAAIIVTLVLLVMFGPTTRGKEGAVVAGPAAGPQAASKAPAAGAAAAPTAGPTVASVPGASPVGPGAAIPSGGSAGGGTAVPVGEGGAAAPVAAALPEGYSGPTEGAAPPVPQPVAAPGDDLSRCRGDGRQKSISIASPQCVPLWKGGTTENGGATWRGVFPDKIDVAYYVPRADPATQAALAAAQVSDQQPDIDRGVDIERRYFNNFFETYGREVVYTKFDASGPSADDVASVADAKKIADANMFAVISSGAGFSPTFNEEVIRRGVICIDCTVSQTKSYLDRTKGYDFSALPGIREYYEQVADYWGKRLVRNSPDGKPRGARYRGDCTPGLPSDPCAQPRKFGLIWIKSASGKVDPGAQEERDNFVENILPKYGIQLSADASYDFDISTGPQQSQVIIQKMNTAKVSTIVMIADPLMPVFFTKEASNEGYFPEWFISGTALTDTTFFGRTYDKGQWAHAYGISPLWVFTDDFRQTDGYREYHLMCPVTPWKDGTNATGEPNCEDSGEPIGINVYRTPPAILAVCLHLAGPTLTPASFAEGCYSYAESGGFPELPLLYFTPDSPTIIKDFVEVWWNSSGTGLDEVNKQGVGILQKSNGGLRTRFFNWISADPYVFGEDPKPVFTTSDYPKAEFDEPPPPEGKRCLSCP